MLLGLALPAMPAIWAKTACAPAITGLSDRKAPRTRPTAPDSESSSPPPLLPCPGGGRGMPQGRLFPPEDGGGRNPAGGGVPPPAPVRTATCWARTSIRATLRVGVPPGQHVA